MGETDATGTSLDGTDTQEKLERTPKQTVKGMVPLQRAPASNATDARREPGKSDE